MYDHIYVGKKLFHIHSLILGKIEVVEITDKGFYASTLKGKLEFKFIDIGKVIFFEERDIKPNGYKNVQEYFEVIDERKEKKQKMLQEREIKEASLRELREMQEKEKKLDEKKKEEEKIEKRKEEVKEKKEAFLRELKEMHEKEKKLVEKKKEDEKEEELYIKEVSSMQYKFPNLFYRLNVKYFRDYYPRNYKPNHVTELILSFKDGRRELPKELENEIISYIYELKKQCMKMAIVLMPSSKKEHWGQGIYNLAGKIIKETGIYDYRELLVRKIDTSSSKSSNRFMMKHFKSIIINNKYSLADIDGFVILDDIISSGNSLDAATAILKYQIGNRNIKIFRLAIAETVRHT